jgi:hypothetical protein
LPLPSRFRPFLLPLSSTFANICSTCSSESLETTIQSSSWPFSPSNTRLAATTLLRAARPFLSPLLVPRPKPYMPCSAASPPIDGFPLLIASFSLSPDPSSDTSDSPPSIGDVECPTSASARSTSPILCLPYETLDLIFSCLSPGHLFSKQHRLVMNWAEDRSTIGNKKADSRTDFLRKTNCWRWESEIERVNLGYGYQ